MPRSTNLPAIWTQAAPANLSGNTYEMMLNSFAFSINAGAGVRHPNVLAMLVGSTSTILSSFRDKWKHSQPSVSRARIGTSFQPLSKTK